MRKLLLLIFFVIFLTFNMVFAYEYPRWVAQPIYVYIPNYMNYSSLMRQAFRSWEKASDSLVRFEFVNSSSNANIEVQFVDYVTNCNSGSAVGCAHTFTRGKNYYKSLITIGTKQKQTTVDGYNVIQKDVNRKKENIYGVMLHEIGHAIGLSHSEDSNSVMYSYDLPTLQYLTKEDLRLLYKKYY